MEGNCTLVPGGSSALNRLKMCKAEKEKCVVVFHMFDYSEPSLNIILQGELMLIPGGSTAPNLLEPLILLNPFSACARRGGGDLAGWLTGCLLQTLGTSVQPWPNTTRQGLPGGSLAGARWLWLGPLWVGLGGGGGETSLAGPVSCTPWEPACNHGQTQHAKAYLGGAWLELAGCGWVLCGWVWGGGGGGGGAGPVSCKPWEVG